MKILIKKNQIIVIKVLLDLMLFLYSHIKSSKNETTNINIKTTSQLIFEKCNSWIGEKVIFDREKKLGILNGISAIVNKTKQNKYGTIKPKKIVKIIRQLRLL